MSTLRFLTLGVVPAWHEQANCDGLGDVMFPELGDHGSVKWAKRVCSGCEVRTTCLEDALDRNEQHGIRGGLTVKERRDLIKQRRNSVEQVAA